MQVNRTEWVPLWFLVGKNYNYDGESELSTPNPLTPIEPMISVTFFHNVVFSRNTTKGL
jgi:hypothetical protein